MVSSAIALAFGAKKEAIPRETASEVRSSVLLRAVHRRVGHRGFIGADRKRLQRLAEVQLAVLLIRVQLVEPLHRVIGTDLVHRELPRELMDNAAGAPPMKKKGGGGEDGELVAPR